MKIGENLTAPSLKDNLLLQSGVQFAALGSLKECAMPLSSKDSVMNGEVCSLKSDVLALKMQLQQVTVITARRIPFSGLKHANGGNLRTNDRRKKEQRLTAFQPFSRRNKLLLFLLHYFHGKQAVTRT